MALRADYAFVAVSIIFLLVPRAPYIPTVSPKDLRDSYDYIIVGAGSGGAVLASRLSEDPGVNVLLIEAGGEGNWFSHVPGFMGLIQKSALDWAFQTEPQKHACFALHNNQSNWPRGKGLGGTSVLNAMFHVWGRPEDHDRWADELGCKGWAWEDVLPYYKKTETVLFTPNSVGRRGTEGPMKVKKAQKSGIAHVFEKALRESGIPIQDEYNGLANQGMYNLELSIANGKRQSTRDTYLERAKLRKNLHILTNAHVTKVLFNADKEATAVQYIHSNSTYKVAADREVVLSAGAIGSPHILMFSGIGPKSHLGEHKIPIVVDSPAVGSNLKDHVLVKLLYEVDSPITLVSMFPLSLRSVSSFVSSALEYAFYGKGLLATSSGVMHGFFASGLNPQLAAPDTQFYLFELDIAPREVGLHNFKDEAYIDEHAASKSPNYFTVASALQQPASSGRLRLRSSNPLDYPAIDPNYLAEPKDVQVLAQGLRTLINIVNRSKAMDEEGARLSEGPLRECADREFLSDDYLECYVRHKTLTIFHPESTCRMGSDPKSSVVDPELKVYGVKNLRIVDASVFPDIMTGNPNIPVMAIAEKAADLMAEERKKSQPE